MSQPPQAAGSNIESHDMMQQDPFMISSIVLAAERRGSDPNYSVQLAVLPGLPRNRPRHHDMKTVQVPSHQKYVRLLCESSMQSEPQLLG